MITKVEKIAFILIGIFIIGFFVFWKTNQSPKGDNKQPTQKEDKNNKSSDGDATTNSEVRVIQKWELPSDLKEISGIAYINDHQFACVQDELGKIFIFNTASNKVEKEISFAEPGDFEGIAVVGPTAYIVSADGKLFAVNDYMTAQPKVTKYSTPLTVKQNVEGLCYDRNNNRLLLSIKGNEPASKDYKGIYAFDIASKNTVTDPVHKIDLTDEIWAETKGKNKMQPSDLEIHPVTNDIYVIDGASPKLLVMDADGNKKKLYQLPTSDFVQPEGIAFTESGEMFISSEGKTGPGTIMKVSVEPAP